MFFHVALSVATVAMERQFLRNKWQQVAPTNNTAKNPADPVNKHLSSHISLHKRREPTAGIEPAYIDYESHFFLLFSKGL
jgi:hypothetical protein